jgi:hypothetical protein
MALGGQGANAARGGPDWPHVPKLAALLAISLAACAPTAVAPPPQRPQITQSAESLALSAYYAAVQQSLLAQGLLRTDGGGADTPLSATMLANSFLRIAFYEEHGAGGRGATPIRLTRWTGPLRIALHFGATVPRAGQAADQARVASYAARLAKLTGLSITLSKTNPNMTVAITNTDERRALGPMIKSALPQITAAQVAGVTALDRSTYCLVWTQSGTGQGIYERAFVYIPAEHPDLMRLACMHEEIAQALGLPNDVGSARPSIFNDDEEFALLTRQDEMFLRILYDPSLRNGMTEAEARPIVEILARQFLGGAS